MEQQAALQVFDCLASAPRLGIFRLLVQAGREGRVAGEISQALAIAPTNLSFHLKTLTQAGLLTVQQEGRYQRYRANIALMLETIAYLTENCCAGHPEDCADLRHASPVSGALLPPLACTPDSHCKP